MNKICLTIFIIISTFASQKTFSQGCSDSGFCTMGALKPDQIFVKKFSIHLNSIELTQHIGHTKYDDWIHSTFLDANFSIGRKTNLQVRLPGYTIVRGKMPTTSGWGDLYFNLSRSIVTKDNYRVYASIGAKIYTSQPDKKSDDGLPMPLYQQTSYGSNDVNVGVSVLSRQWMVAIAYQHALNQISNKFTTQQWEGHTLYDVVKVYDQSAGLARGDDFMFRVERNFRLSRFNFYVGALQLWRLNQDRTLNEQGILTPVAGSDGLAMNLLAGGGYQFNTRMGIRVLVSARLKERDSNPDGLSRNLIGQLAYIVRF